MKFTLEIKLGDDAMQTYEDIASALHITLQGIKEQSFNDPQVGDLMKIGDRKGNTVGKWEVTA